MFTRKTPIYWLLAAVWIVILAWQGLEHRRVTRLARDTTVRRALDIGRTLELVIRSQRRFFGVVFQPSLTAALSELLKSDELKSIALLNKSGEVVAAAGEPLDFTGKGLPQNSVIWDKNTATVINLVDLGNPQPDGQPSSPTIVLPGNPGRRDERPRFPPPEPRPDQEETNAPGPSRSLMDTNNPPPPDAASQPPGNRPERRPGFHRPPWVSEEEYKVLVQQKGFHALAIAISAQAYRTAWLQDLWLRSVIGLFATLSMVGIGFSWRNLGKSSELQMRLLRASEMNTHLREMNVAAAGLAHETRNPLNIIRGVAQLISKDSEAGEPVRKKSLEIMDEVDYVTVRLNEFINYSRPREVRRSPVDLSSAVNDVVRSLNSDLEDKKIKLDLKLETFSANADQQMLRQILFNLLINAIQAVAPGGQIQIVSKKNRATEGYFEIRDNGPGVSIDHRQDIFRPYFTTRKDGTGLGLAVVKQIVSLHGWEVEYLPNDGPGSVFRVNRIEALSASPA